MNGDQGMQKQELQDGAQSNPSVTQQQSVPDSNPVPASPVSPAQPLEQPEQPNGFYRAESLSQTPQSPSPALADEAPVSAQLQSPSQSQSNPEAELPEGVTWTVSPELARAHLSGWRMRMIVLSLLLGAIIFLITGGDWVSSGSVALVGLLFSVLGSRRQQNLTYQVDYRGIMIGPKVYAFGDFRAFSVFQDGPMPSVELVPLKRFMPPVIMRLDKAQGEQVVNLLTKHLPMQKHRQDFVDHLVTRARI